MGPTTGRRARAARAGRGVARALAAGLATAAPAAAQDAPSVFDCLIEPSARVELASEVAGVIDAVHVRRGDMVEAGQLIAALRSDIEIANRELAAARAQDRTTLAVKQAQETFERRRLERNESLIAERVVNAQEADELRTAVEVASRERQVEEAALAQAGLELKRARAVLAARSVESPISGVVLSRDKEPGEHVDGEAIVTIVTLDPLFVEVFAPIPVAKRLRVGGPAEVLSPNEPPMAATIETVDRVADAASRTVKVRLTLPNPDFSVIAGQNCRARFALGADR